VLLLAVEGRTPGLTHHNVSFPANYDDEFDAIFGKNPQPVEDPTIYICSPDDDRMRPSANHESWFVLVNAPRHDPVNGVNWNDSELVTTYTEHILDVMEQRGFGVRDRLVWAESRTPAQFERITRAPGGSIYGTASNGPRAAFGGDVSAHRGRFDRRCLSQLLAHYSRELEKADHTKDDPSKGRFAGPNIG
jgi:phytoene dehydrogenase-like protein